MTLRDCADRSGATGRTGLPSVAGPRLGKQASYDDHRIGKRDECREHPDPSPRADGEFAKAASVPRIRSLHHPPGCALNGHLRPFGCDLAGIAEVVQQLAGSGGSIAGVQMDRDRLLIGDQGLDLFPGRP